MTVNIKGIFVVFLICSLSLQSYFTWHAIVILLIILLCMFLTTVVSKTKLSRHILYALSFSATSIIFFMLLPYFIGGHFEVDYMMVYLKLLLCLCIALYVSVLLKSKEGHVQLFNAFDICLKLHLSFFFVQTLLLYIFSIHLDPMQLIGRAQRVLGASNFGFYRPSGFFNEPGTYFAMMLIVVFSRYALLRKQDGIYAIALISFYITLSVQALIITPFLTIKYLLNSELTKYFKVILFIFIFSIFSLGFYFVSEFLMTRVSTNDGTVSVRLEALSYYLSQDQNYWLVGSGIAINNCQCLMADTGLWFTILSGFGFFGLLIILSLFIYFIITRSYLYCLFFLVVLLSKIEFDYYLFWVFISILLLTSCKRNRHDL